MNVLSGAISGMKPEPVSIAAPQAYRVTKTELSGQLNLGIYRQLSILCYTLPHTCVGGEIGRRVSLRN